MDDELLIRESDLWDLVDKWRADALNTSMHRPFLSRQPQIAIGQGMNSCAEDLSDLILALDEGRFA